MIESAPSIPAASTGNRRTIRNSRCSPIGSMERNDPFRYYLRVRYIECDAQKVVFNSRYAEYVDVGINEFLRAAGILDQFVYGHLDFFFAIPRLGHQLPDNF